MRIELTFEELVDAPWWHNFARATRRQTRKNIDVLLKDYNAKFIWNSGNWTLIFKDETDFSMFLLKWS